MWLLLLGVPLLAQQLQFATIAEATVVGRLQRIARGENETRMGVLRTMFAEAGCEVEEEKAKGSKLPNLVCALGGDAESDLILVTAHFDKVRAGAGAIDNWTGASLLPSLYQSLLHGKALRHRFLFIGLTDEEAGLVGSRAWVGANRKTLLKRVRAVVNVDSVAAAPLPLYIWASRSDPELARMALGIGRVLKIPVEGMNVEKVGNSDTAPFRDAKVPTIDFHALSNKTWPILHTIDDQLSMVNVDAYKATYRFLAVYLKYLDEALAPAGSASAGLK